jgi:hypothetical protein
MEFLSTSVGDVIVDENFVICGWKSFSNLLRTYCHVYVWGCVTVRGDIDWLIQFIGHLYTPLGTTNNYNTISNLHTLQFTVSHTLGFSVFTICILATDFNTVIISVSL